MATVGRVNENRLNQVYDQLVLYTTPEKFLIEPLQSPNELLVIDRVSRDISLQDNQGQIPASATSKPICGIFGIIHLLAGPYLIVITKRSKVVEINGQPIWRVDGTEMFSFSRTLLHLTDEQMQYNKIYVSMIQMVLQMTYFYFSPSYDLSHTLQRLFNTSPDFLDLPLFDRADQRFIWNYFIMRDLKNQPELCRYCLPVIHGLIASNQCSINGKMFSLTLISRRSCTRAGTRLFMRGVNSEGHVANYVETEQIVEYQGARSSFVQTRGSVPLFWNQLPNLRYKPDPTLVPNVNHAEAFRRHFESQFFAYSCTKQVIINLIDHKGPEKVLEEAFANAVKQFNHPLIRYESFDFHYECRKMRWDRLSILMDRVDADLRDFGYFMMTRDGQVPMVQDGIFRTNCIDCLDRTNVVQNLLARRSLQEQLQKFAILRPGKRIDDQTAFEAMYKNMWGDNADVCSIQYSGTGALKTDFTRTGKRTKFGLLKDGLNSAIRYYKNNFADGYRQDAIDLFLGRYQVEEFEGTTTPCPLRERKDLKFLALPMVFLVAVAMCFLSLLIPTIHSTESFMFVVFWVGMVVVTLSLIIFYGVEFVDYPKLRHFRPKDKYE